MKLIEMKCPNCHAIVDVDDSKKEFFCSYCRMTTKIDDEVIKVEHTIVDNALNEKIKVANTYLFDFEDYEKAISSFEQLSLEYPYEAKVWWGLIQCLTKNFCDNKFNAVDEMLVYIAKCDEYFDKYFKVERDNGLREVNFKKYFEYMGNYALEYLKKLEDYVVDQHEYLSYEEAYIDYKDWLERLTEKYPNCSLVWWSLIQLITVNFDTDVYYDEEMLSICDEYLKKCLMVEKNEKFKDNYKKTFDEYVNKVMNGDVHTNIKFFSKDMALWLIFVISGIIVLFFLIGIFIS